MNNNLTICAAMFAIMSLVASSYSWSSCLKELSGVVASSNFKGLYPRESQSVELVLDSLDDGVITAKVKYVAVAEKAQQGFQGDQGVGWIKYNELTGELFEMDVADGEMSLRKLKAEDKMISAYKACNKKSLVAAASASDLEFRHMVVRTPKKRSYFYSVPADGSEIKNLFVIDGDMVQAFQSQNEFTRVRYIKRNKTRTSTNLTLGLASFRLGPFIAEGTLA